MGQNNLNGAEIGRRIRVLRKEKGFKSQATFAEHLNKDVKTIKNWETGKVIPSAESLNELRNLFDCDFGYLLCEYDCKTKETADIQAVTGLSARAIDSISHVGEKKLKDGYYALSGGLQKKILNEFLESKEFKNVMLQLLLHYALYSEKKSTSRGDDFTGADLEKAEQVAESLGSVILGKKDAAEFHLSIAADLLKQFSRKIAEKGVGDNGQHS